MYKKQKSSRWIHVAFDVWTGIGTSTCPSCGSSNLHCYKKRITKEGGGYGVVWCADCMKGHWISRITVNEDSGEEPPKGIRLI